MKASPSVVTYSGQRGSAGANRSVRQGRGIKGLFEWLAHSTYQEPIWAVEEEALSHTGPSRKSRLFFSVQRTHSL